MAWFPWFGGKGWGRHGWAGPWPGRGPFSHLPPWQRPGWLFGRGACRWLLGLPWAPRWYPPWYGYYPPYYYPPAPPAYYPWYPWW